MLLSAGDVVTNLEEEQDLLAEERLRIIGIVTGVCFVLIIPFVLNNIWNGRWLVSIAALMVIAVLCSNFVSIYLKKKPPIDIVYLIPVIMVFLVSCFAKQGLIGAFWCFPTLVGMHFILERRHAALAEKIFLCLGAVGGYSTLEFALFSRFIVTLAMTTVFCRFFLRIISVQRGRLLTLSEDLTKKVNQLEETNRKLEEAEGHRREFLATVSHEFRTPMNAVIGFTDLALSRDPGDKKIRRDLLRISNASRNLLALLNDILDFAKIEAGKLKIKQTSFSLTALSREVQGMFGSASEGKGLKLQCRVEPGTPEVMVGDPLRIKQILINLLGNAIKFTKRGSIELSISRDAQTGIRFRVTDTGIGIPPARLEELFQPFHQLHSEPAPESGGTGLGLSICRRLVELMGGKLEVESTVAKGSAFTFSLPVSGLDHLPIYSQPSTNAHNRVLLLTPNEEDRRWLDEVLSGFRFEVSSFASDEKALEQLFDHFDEYRLLVVDAKFFSHDSWTSFRTALSQAPERPKILLIQELADKDVDSQISQGVLKKPLTASMVLDAIADLTDVVDLPNLLRQDTHVHASERPLLGRRILVVDDVPPNRELAEELLHKLGAVVECASDGEEALAKALESRFDAVLMDVNMPGIDGYEATRRWRQSGDQETFIVAMTAHATEAAKEKSLEVGMNAHISKPISLQALHETLTPFFDLKPRPAGSPDPALSQTNLRGIDMEEALDRLGGSHRLLSRLVASFCRKYAELENELATIVKEEDWSLLKERAHELKGAAANISAVAIRDTALELEKCAPDQVPGLLERLGRKLDELRAGIEHLSGGGPEEKSPVGSLDPQQLRTLREQLSNQDMLALGVLESVSEPLRQTMGEERFRKLEEACQDLQFEEALRLLDDSGFGE